MKGRAVLCAGLLAVASGCHGSRGLVLGGADAGVDGSIGNWDSAPPCLVPVRAACVPGPNEPTSLGVLGNFGLGLGMISLGHQLIIAMENAGPSSAVPASSLVFVSLVSGSITVQELGELYPGYLRAMGNVVVYSPGMPGRVNTDGWSFTYSKVLRWDLETGETLTLDNPVRFDSPFIDALAWNARGEIFWSLWDRGQRSVIAKWDPCTQTSTTIREGIRFNALQADDSALYWQEFFGGYMRTTFSSAPIAGGSVSLLFQARPMDNDIPWLRTSDDEHLYYDIGYGSAPGFYALPKSGGTPSVILPGGTASVLAMDDQHIYFTDSEVRQTLLRVRKVGDMRETVWHGQGERWASAVTTDECNVYWVAELPREVFYKAK